MIPFGTQNQNSVQEIEKIQKTRELLFKSAMLKENNQQLVDARDFYKKAQPYLVCRQKSSNRNF